MKPIRFEQTVNDRIVAIDVHRVSRDRWRAELARTAGRTTALMPFYAATPDEAAQQLVNWLARVSRKTG